MAFIAKLGEQSYTVEIEETGKSVYRVSVVFSRVFNRLFAARGFRRRAR